MTSFVESCIETAAGSAVAAQRAARHRPRAGRLIRLLADRRNILITTHQHPDPDALASCIALWTLLQAKLKDSRVSISVKGTIGGGYNEAFVQLSDVRLIPWEEGRLSEFDAIILLDVPPSSKFSPLPSGVAATAIIDHHRARGRKPACPFCDIRTDVGATCSIIFSYFMELEVDLPPDLAATMLFGVETDLAGAAGQPGELDNLALSSLTLLADTRKLYKMRYAALPQGIYQAYATGLENAVYYESAMISHIDTVDSPEAPAVIADFLLRFSPVQWVLVSALSGQSLVLSLRTSNTKSSAADVMRRLLRNLGEGGGHRAKAGGAIPLSNATPGEIDRIRKSLRQRLLRALGIAGGRGQKLVK